MSLSAPQSDMLLGHSDSQIQILYPERERERDQSGGVSFPNSARSDTAALSDITASQIRQPTRVWQHPYFGHGISRIFVSTALRGRKLATEVLSYHHLQTVHRRLPIKSTFCQPPLSLLGQVWLAGWRLSSSKQGQEFPFHGIKLWKLATGAYIGMQKPKRPAAAAASTMSSCHTFDRHLQGL